MSLLIDQALDKMPKEKKRKETVNNKLDMKFGGYKIAYIFPLWKAQKEIPLRIFRFS